MKKHIDKITTFSKTIGKGLNVELKETIEIPSLIRNKEYKKAGYQVVDLFKMTGLTIVWIVPGGAVLTSMILKFSHKSRPSAFQVKEEDDTLYGEGGVKKDLPGD
ncbi:hypothetical protein [Sulfurovum sp.]|uniref:hypothetical protein n=1 Tax=Sulfurovum sp. TaxID=1969726 RepID=UPI0025EBA89F|nr:hypothetical protein [Sulfurovum sp.]